MKTYKVTVREIAEQDILVQANSEDDAIMAVREGEGNYDGSIKYTEVLDPESWSIEEMGAG